jgi:hypothetical protein
MMDKIIAGRTPEPAAGRRAGRAARALIAGGLVLVGLLAAVGGDSAAFVVAGLRSRSPDWGLVVALGVFGLLLAAFGECLSLDPTPVARAEAAATTTAIPEAYRRRGSKW